MPTDTHNRPTTVGEIRVGGRIFNDRFSWEKWERESLPDERKPTDGE